MSKKLLLGLSIAAFSISTITAIEIWLRWRDSKESNQLTDEEYQKLREQVQKAINEVDSASRQKLYQKEFDAIENIATEQNVLKLKELLDKISRQRSDEQLIEDLNKAINALDPIYSKKEQLREELRQENLSRDQLLEIEDKVAIALVIETLLKDVEDKNKKQQFISEYNSENTLDKNNLQTLLEDIQKHLEQQKSALEDAKDKAEQRSNEIKDEAKKQELADKLKEANTIEEVNKIRQEIEEILAKQDQKLIDLEKEQAKDLNSKVEDQAKKEEFEKRIDEAKTKEEIDQIKEEILKELQKTLSPEEILAIQKEALDKKVENSDLDQQTKDALKEEIKNATNIDQFKEVEQKVDDLLWKKDAKEKALEVINRLKDSDKKQELLELVNNADQDDSKSAKEIIASYEDAKNQAQAILDAAKEAAQNAINKLGELPTTYPTTSHQDQIKFLQDELNNSFTQEHYEKVAQKVADLLAAELQKARELLKELQQHPTLINNEHNLANEKPLADYDSQLNNEENAKNLDYNQIQQIIKEETRIKEKLDLIQKIKEELKDLPQAIQDELDTKVRQAQSEEDIDNLSNEIDAIRQQIADIKELSDLSTNPEFKDSNLQDKLSAITTTSDLNTIEQNIKDSLKQEYKDKIDNFAKDSVATDQDQIDQAKAKVDQLATLEDFKNFKTDLDQTSQNKQNASSNADSLDNTSAKDDFNNQIANTLDKDKLNEINNQIEQYKQKQSDLIEKIENLSSTSQQAKDTLKEQLKTEQNNTIEKLEEFSKLLDQIAQAKQEANDLLQNTTAKEFSATEKEEFKQRIDNATSLSELEQIMDELNGSPKEIALKKQQLKEQIDAFELNSDLAKETLKAEVDAVSTLEELKALKDKINELEQAKTNAVAKTENLNPAAKDNFKELIKNAVEKTNDQNQNSVSEIEKLIDSYKDKYNELKEIIKGNGEQGLQNFNQELREQLLNKIEDSIYESQLDQTKADLIELDKQKQELKQQIINSNIQNEETKSFFNDLLLAADSKEKVAQIKEQLELASKIVEKIAALPQDQAAKSELLKQAAEAKSSLSDLQHFEAKIVDLQNSTQQAIDAINNQLQNSSEQAKENLINEIKSKFQKEPIDQIKDSINEINLLKQEGIDKNNQLEDQQLKDGFLSEIQNATTQEALREIIQRIQQELDKQKELKKQQAALIKEINDFAAETQNPAKMSETVKQALIDQVEQAKEVAALNPIREDFLARKDVINSTLDTINQLQSSNDQYKQDLKQSLKEKLASDQMNSVSALNDFKAVVENKKNALETVERLNDSQDKTDKLNTIKTSDDNAVINAQNTAAQAILDNSYAQAQKAIARLSGSDTGLKATLEQELNASGTKFTQAQMDSIVSRSDAEFNPLKQEVENLIQTLDIADLKAALEKEFNDHNTNQTQTIATLKDIKNRIEIAKAKKDAQAAIDKLVDGSATKHKLSDELNAATTTEQIAAIKKKAEDAYSSTRDELNRVLPKLEGATEEQKAKIAALSGQNATQEQLQQAINEINSIFNKKHTDAFNAIEEIKDFATQEQLKELNDALANASNITKLQEVIQKANELKENHGIQVAKDQARQEIEKLPTRPNIAGYSESDTAKAKLLAQLDQTSDLTEIERIKNKAQELKPLMETALATVDKLNDSTTKTQLIKDITNALESNAITAAQTQAQQILDAKRTMAQAAVEKTLGLVATNSSDQSYDKLKQRLAAATTEQELINITSDANNAYEQVLNAAKDYLNNTFKTSSDVSEDKKAHFAAALEGTQAQNLESRSNVQKINELLEQMKIQKAKDEAKALNTKLTQLPGHDVAQFAQQIESATSVAQVEQLKAQLQQKLNDYKQATKDVLAKLNNSNDQVTAVDSATTAAEIKAIKDAAEQKWTQLVTEANNANNKLVGHSEKADYDTKIQNAQTEAKLAEIKAKIDQIYDQEKAQAQSAVNALQNSNPDKYSELNKKLNDQDKADQRDNVQKLRDIAQQATEALATSNKKEAARLVIESLPTENKQDISQTAKQQLLDQLNAANISDSEIDALKQKAQELKAKMEDALAEVYKLDPNSQLRQQLTDAIINDASGNSIAQNKQRAIDQINKTKAEAQAALNKVVGQDNIQPNTHAKLTERLTAAITEQAINQIKNDAQAEFNREQNEVATWIAKLPQNQQAAFNTRKNNAANVTELRAISQEIQAKLNKARQDAQAAVAKLAGDEQKASFDQRLASATTVAEYEAITREATQRFNTQKDSATAAAAKLSDSAQRNDAINKAPTVAELKKLQKSAEDKYKEIFDQTKAKIEKVVGDQTKYEELKRRTEAKPNQADLEAIQREAQTTFDNYLNTNTNPLINQLQQLDPQLAQTYRQKTQEASVNIAKLKELDAQINADITRLNALKEAKVAVNALPVANNASSNETAKAKLLAQLENSQLTTQQIQEIKQKALDLKPKMDQALAEINKLNTSAKKTELTNAVVNSTEASVVDAKKNEAINYIKEQKRLAEVELAKAVGLTTTPTNSTHSHTSLQNRLNSATTEQQILDIKRDITSQYDREKAEATTEVQKLKASEQTALLNSLKTAPNVDEIRKIKKQAEDKYNASKNAAVAAVAKLQGYAQKSTFDQRMAAQNVNQATYEQITTDAAAVWNQQKAATLAEINKLKDPEKQNLTNQINDNLNWSQLQAIKQDATAKLEKLKTDARAELNSKLEQHPDLQTLLNELNNAQNQQQIEDVKAKITQKLQQAKDQARSTVSRLSDANKQTQLQNATTYKQVKALETEAAALLNNLQLQAQAKLAMLDGYDAAKKKAISDKISNTATESQLRQAITEADKAYNDFKAEVSAEVAKLQSKDGAEYTRLNNLLTQDSNLSQRDTIAKLKGIKERAALSLAKVNARDVINKLDGHTTGNNSYSNMTQNLNSATTLQRVEELKNTARQEYQRIKAETQEKVRQLPDGHLNKEQWLQEIQTEPNARRLYEMQATVDNWKAQQALTAEERKTAQDQINKITDQKKKQELQQELNNQNLTVEQVKRIQDKAILENLILSEYGRPNGGLETGPQAYLTTVRNITPTYYNSQDNQAKINELRDLIKKQEQAEKNDLALGSNSKIRIGLNNFHLDNNQRKIDYSRNYDEYVEISNEINRIQNKDDYYRLLARIKNFK
ncbi:hypothetical protein [Mycoplasma procyoni]|uniref:hypothetical protein n=1 Tax=Mycoplasma procyoni TaxID=568784 RepID=UPI00197B7866|nr:hypothetical protein [Mycoplasma procyoni]MBN3534654.1 hypothetical protein [Mycoplasma procyoni]